MRLSAALACALLFALAGCGYHAVGTTNNLTPGIQSIAVPTFINKTQSYRVEQVLTAAVVRELTARTKYKIINHDSSDADATLKATVIDTRTSPLTYDSTTGRASTSLVIVTVNVSLVDRKGKVIFQNPNYTFRDEYQISRELSSFFDEETPALDRLSRDFASDLVSNVLEGF